MGEAKIAPLLFRAEAFSTIEAPKSATRPLREFATLFQASDAPRAVKDLVFRRPVFNVVPGVFRLLSPPIQSFQWVGTPFVAAPVFWGCAQQKFCIALPKRRYCFRATILLWRLTSRPCYKKLIILDFPYPCKTMSGKQNLRPIVPPTPGLNEMIAMRFEPGSAFVAGA
jgi:hypothetical protein